MAEEKKKKEKMIDIFHGTKHHIQVKESLVDAHVKAGWRLKK